MRPVSAAPGGEVPAARTSAKRTRPRLPRVPWFLPGIQVAAHSLVRPHLRGCPGGAGKRLCLNSARDGDGGSALPVLVGVRRGVRPSVTPRCPAPRTEVAASSAPRPPRVFHSSSLAGPPPGVSVSAFPSLGSRFLWSFLNL